MSLRVAYAEASPRQEVLKDLARLETIWTEARKHRISEGPWLLGKYTAADAFFAPVAGRIAGYSLPRRTAGTSLCGGAFERSRIPPLARNGVGPWSRLPWYRKDYPQTDWPGPAPLKAKAVMLAHPRTMPAPIRARQQRTSWNWKDACLVLQCLLP